MRILLNSKIPIPAPIINGVRNFELFLRSLKKFKILSKSFSYIPKITQSTPLLIPGRIAPAPMLEPNLPFYMAIKNSKNINFEGQALLFF